MPRRSLALPVVICLCLLSLPGLASAQDESHWGVAVGWVPTWEAHDSMKFLFNDAESLAMTGDDFRIGIARGKARGGDWSLSYIRKRLDPGSRSVVQEPHLEFVSGIPQAVLFTEQLIVQDVRLDGIEWDKYVNFATIARHVQIGMNFGAGVAKIKGTVIRQQAGLEFVPPFALVPVNVETVEPANELLIGEVEWMPLAKIELAVGAHIAHGIKVRVSGGFSMPAIPAIGLTVVYLFGAK